MLNAPEGFDPAFAFNDGRPLAIGFSGGGDSLALLTLLRAAAPQRRFLAVVVDHGLRAGSAADAARAADQARALGAEACVAPALWNGTPHRAHASARRARHLALITAATAFGADTIALGHTLDDQLETLLIRSDAKSGRRGMAGMRPKAPSPIWPEGRGLTLVRPLLAARRANLRAWLKDEGLGWFDDPANDDPAFARTAARQTVSGYSASEAAAWIANATEIAAENDAIDREVARRLDIGPDWAGRFAIERDRLAAWDREVRLRALEVLTVAASGRERPPDAERLDGLDRALLQRTDTAKTLGGCLVRIGGRLCFQRDPGTLVGRDGRLALAPRSLSAAPVVWDGRIEASAGTDGIVIVPRGRPPDKAEPEIRVGAVAWQLDEATAEGFVAARPLGQMRVRRLLGAGESAITPA